MASASPHKLQNKKVGIIAGNGELPLQLIKQLQSQGRLFHILLVDGEAYPADYAGLEFDIFPITKIGKFLKSLSNNDCELVTMVGGVKRPNLKNILPDAEGLKLLKRIGGSLGQGDDALLKAVTNFIEEKGFQVVGAHELDDSLMVSEGVIGSVAPTEDDHKDILRGVEIARQIGDMDIGQSIVIRNGYVLAVEAAEGTAEMIRRCATFKEKHSGGILVKLPKPGQEKRADMPTVGRETISQMKDAGLSGLVIQAESSLILNSEEFIRAAGEAGIFVYAVLG